MASKRSLSSAQPVAPAEIGVAIEAQVLAVRGHRVLLAQQLAVLYGLETKVLNQAVRRNLERFPSDFMFQLEPADLATLRSQTVTLNAQVLDSKAFLTAAGVTANRGEHADTPHTLLLNRV